MNRHKCTSFNNNKEAEGGNGNGGLFVKRTVLYSVHIIYLAHAHCCAGDAVILVYIYVNIYSIWCCGLLLQLAAGVLAGLAAVLPHLQPGSLSRHPGAGLPSARPGAALPLSPAPPCPLAGHRPLLRPLHPGTLSGHFIEEGFIQKRCQWSSLLFGGQSCHTTYFAPGCLKE